MTGELLMFVRYAYLTFGSQSRMQEAYRHYTSRPIYISGHLMRINKYQPPKDVPIGVDHILLLSAAWSVLQYREIYLQLQKPY